MGFMEYFKDQKAKEARARKEKQKQMSKGAAVGVGIGAAIGALTGILFAPKSGKETRAEIAEKAKETAEDAKVKATQVKATVVKSVDGIKEKVKDMHKNRCCSKDENIVEAEVLEESVEENEEKAK